MWAGLVGMFQMGWAGPEGWAERFNPRAREVGGACHMGVWGWAERSNSGGGAGSRAEPAERSRGGGGEV